MEIVSSSSNHTLELGEHIGSRLRGGECFALQSDVGGGKTTLTKGIAIGFGSVETASSPSFTISNVYSRNRDSLRIMHFDFYRLEDPGIIAHELEEHVADEHTVTIVEWSDTVANILPKDCIIVTILATSEDSRRITIQYADKHHYLFEDIGVKS